MLVLAQLSRNWWVFLLRGIVGILFGVLAFMRPGITLEVLVLLFAFWALFDGVFSLISSIGAAEAKEPWWPLVFIGLLGIAAGIFTLRYPGVTTLTLLFVIAFWSIFRGIFEIIAAVRLREIIQGEWWLILGGIASIVFGVLLVTYPASGLLAVIWLIGLYAVIFGITQIMFGFRLKNLAGELPAPAANARGTR
jgi:uncharacterized membrane protein HdeD (DUF308 family)